MTGLGQGWAGPADAGPPPRNHLAWAICSTLLCSLPIGVVSIVFASRVNGRWAAGDHVGAAEAATRARQWAWAAVVVGLAFDVLIGFALLEAGGLPRS